MQANKRTGRMLMHFIGMHGLTLPFHGLCGPMPADRSSANRYATHVKSCTDCVCLAFVVSHLIIYNLSNG